jgi:hypothetical protein
MCKSCCDEGICFNTPPFLCNCFRLYLVMLVIMLLSCKCSVYGSSTITEYSPRQLHMKSRALWQSSRFLHHNNLLLVMMANCTETCRLQKWDFLTLEMYTLLIFNTEVCLSLRSKVICNMYGNSDTAVHKTDHSVFLCFPSLMQHVD